MWLLISYIGFNVIWAIRLIFWFAILTKLRDRFGLPVWLKALAAIFIVIDVLFNYQLTLLMLDLPHDWKETTTYRLKRYRVFLGGTGKRTWIEKWRLMWANWACPILNKYDEGHC